MYNSFNDIDGFFYCEILQKMVSGSFCDDFCKNVYCVGV